MKIVFHAFIALHIGGVGFNKIHRNDVTTDELLTLMKEF